MTKIFLSIIFSILAFSFFLAQEGHFIKIDNDTLYYNVMGEGAPILIINGGPGFSSEGFANLADEIAELGYQTILFDQRGTGKSKLEKVDSTTVSLDLMVQDMELIRQDLNLQKWIILGHSFGGMLANQYATQFPERVSAIIHSSSGGVDLALLDSAQQTFLSRLTTNEIDSLQYWGTKVDENPTKLNRRKYYSYLASAYVFHKENVPIITDRLMQGDMAMNQLVWNNMRAMPFDCKEKLKSFKAPVLIIQGKEDVLPEAIAKTTHSIFSNSDLYIIEDCGHYGWLDQKEKYLNHIKNFLTQFATQ